MFIFLLPQNDADLFIDGHSMVVKINGSERAVSFCNGLVSWTAEDGPQVRRMVHAGETGNGLVIFTCEQIDEPIDFIVTESEAA